MKKAIAIWALVAAALAGACSMSPPELQVVYDAAQAVGGPQLVLALQAMELRGAGTGTVTDYRRTVVFCCGNAIPFRPNGQMHLVQTRMTPASSAPAAVQQEDITLDGSTGFELTAAGVSQPLSEAVAREQRIEMLHHPITAIRAALEHGAKVTNAREENDEQMVDITTTGGDTVTLLIDRSTKLPTRVRSLMDDPGLGRVVRETAFADYAPVNEQLLMPRRLTTKVGAETVAEIRVTRNLVDGNAGSGMQAMGIGRIEGPRRSGRGARGGQ